MRRLFSYLKPHIVKISFGMIIKTIGTVMDLFIPYILAHIINNVAKNQSKREILLWGTVMLTCSVIAVVFNIIANRMASKVAADSIKSIRHDLFSRISYLSSSQTDELTIASLESRLTGDTYNVHHFIGMSQRLGIRAPVLLLGGIVITFSLDVPLTLVMLCTFPFIYYIVYGVSKKGIPLYGEVQKKTDAFTHIVREDAAGIRVIKAFSKTGYEKKRFDKANCDSIAVEKKAGITMAKINPLMTFILNFGLCAVIVVGAFLVGKEKSEVGTIIAFMSYFTIIANALINVSRIFVMSSKGLASMKRIDEVLSTEPILWVDETEPAEACESIPTEAFIEFRGVDFSYKNTLTLQNVSFTLEKEQTLGIIGTTGSGKSTLINLLMRFYDTSEGEILINGENIKNIPTKRLRKMFGVVFQNDFLFADTIKENVRFGRDIDDSSIDKALEFAQAKNFVEDTGHSGEHMLEIKGANLSGGQKQRLLIARALAANPDILILDDSSSALDYKTDSNLRKAIAANFSRTTTIIVAQRISSIMHADKIIVLEGGKIIGCGTHDELVESCPYYEQTRQSQMGGVVCE